MPSPLHLATVVGARPQIIKAAAITHAVQVRNDGADRAIEEMLVHTGQHYDRELSDLFFEEYTLPEPDYNLGIGSGTHGEQTGAMLTEVETVLQEEDPDVVLVHGDTNSTLAGALAAAKLQIPVAHVEAGLRSFNRRMPEEVNRVVTDHLSTWLLCPSETAVHQLADEGIDDGVHLVGDIMYDLLQRTIPKIRSDPDLAVLLDRHGLEPGAYAVATVHRPENTDELRRLRAVFDGLARIADQGLPVLAPLHPRTVSALEEHGVDPESVEVIDPVSHRQMLRLVADARVVLTDSGGLQKEAYWLDVPCVTLRDETEWEETVEAGWNVLVGADTDRIVDAASDPPRAADHPDLYGDGQAAEAILDILLDDAERG